MMCCGQVGFCGIPILIDSPRIPVRSGYYAQEYGKRRWRPLVRKRVATTVVEDGAVLNIRRGGQEQFLMTRATFHELEARVERCNGMPG